MTFLKKLGSALAQGIAMVSGIWPLVAPLFGSKAASVTGTVGNVVNDLTNIAQVITTVEATMQTPGGGAAKLAAAGPLVYNILVTSEAFAGHKVANPTAAATAAQEIASAIADFMNALSPDTVQTTGKPLPVPSGSAPTATS